MYPNQQDNDWDEFLPTVQLTINNTYNEMIGETLFLALFGYDSPSASLTSPKINHKEDDITNHLKRVTEIRDNTRNMFLKKANVIHYPG